MCFVAILLLTGGHEAVRAFNAKHETLNTKRGEAPNYTFDGKVN